MLIAAETGTSGSIWPTIGMFALLFGLMYLMFIRPQSKRRKEAEQMQKALGAGDQVITIGGLHGTVVSADDSTVEIEIADGVTATFERHAIGRVAKPTTAQDAADEPASPIEENKKTS